MAKRKSQSNDTNMDRLLKLNRKNFSFLTVVFSVSLSILIILGLLFLVGNVIAARAIFGFHMPLSQLPNEKSGFVYDVNVAIGKTDNNQTPIFVQLVHNMKAVADFPVNLMCGLVGDETKIYLAEIKTDQKGVATFLLSANQPIETRCEVLGNLIKQTTFTFVPEIFTTPTEIPTNTPTPLPTATLQPISVDGGVIVSQQECQNVSEDVSFYDKSIDPLVGLEQQSDKKIADLNSSSCIFVLPSLEINTKVPVEIKGWIKEIDLNINNSTIDLYFQTPEMQDQYVVIDKQNFDTLKEKFIKIDERFFDGYNFILYKFEGYLFSNG
jgi:hypothetical protein